MSGKDHSTIGSHRDYMLNTKGQKAPLQWRPGRQPLHKWPNLRREVIGISFKKFPADSSYHPELRISSWGLALHKYVFRGVCVCVYIYSWSYSKQLSHFYHGLRILITKVSALLSIGKNTYIIYIIYSFNKFYLARSHVTTWHAFPEVLQWGVHHQLRNILTLKMLNLNPIMRQCSEKSRMLDIQYDNNLGSSKMSMTWNAKQKRSRGLF